MTANRDSTGPPLATENAAMPPDETVSDFGRTAAKRAAVAEESRRDSESGSVRTQQEFLARDAQITDAMRRKRAEEADIHNTPNDQHKNDRVMPDA
jgi:hypothetical protein